MKILAFLPFSFLFLLHWGSQAPATSVVNNAPLMRDTTGLAALVTSAASLVDERQMDSAQILLDSAHAICLQALGERVPIMADILHQMARIKNFKYRPDEAIALNEQALAIRRQWFGETSREVSASYESIGINHYYASRHFDALHYFKKVEAIAAALPDAEDDDLPAAWNLIGIVHSELSFMDSSLIYAQKTLDARLQKLGDRHKLVGIAYQNLGVSYDEIGDYDRAIAIKLKALAIIEAAEGTDNENYATTCMNIGVSHYRKGDYDEAITWLSLAYTKNVLLFGERDRRTLANSNNLAGCYDGKKAHAESIRIKKKALTFADDIYGDTHIQLAVLYNNLGHSFLNNGQPDSALHYLTESIACHRRLHKGADHPTAVPAFRNTGMALLAQGRYSAAEDHVRRAIALMSRIRQGDLAPLAKLYEDLGDIAHGTYRATGDTRHLEEAISHADHAFGIYQEKLQKVSLGTKWSLTPTLSKLGDRLIGWRMEMAAISGKLGFQHDAFRVAEQSRAMILLQSVLETKARRFAKVPDRLLDKEQELGGRIRLAENQLRSLQLLNTPDTDKAVLALNAQLFDLEEQLGAVRQAIRASDKYHPTQAAAHVMTVEEIQKALGTSQQCMLEYFLADSTIYAFVVRPDTFAVVAMPRPAELGRRIAQLREGIYGYHTAAARPDALYSRLAHQYAEAAVWLHQALVAPVAPLLTTQVVLVPDGELGLIPFDALLARPPAQPTAFDTHDYLGGRHQLSITYSAILWREMREKAHKAQPKGEVLAMAPFFWGPGKERARATYVGRTALPAQPAEALAALPHSGEECRSIAGPKSRVLLGAQASKAAFLSEAPHHRILHLSTHGVADDRLGDYAYLAFCVPGDITRFEKLYVRDLYGLTLHADLVVLSACQTVTGRFQRGEGIISLTRAFTYAGAKGIVATLWDINDEKTATLMQALHTGLRNARTTPGQALWKAKKDFLGKYKEENAHPYYWAGVIGIGI